MDLTRNCDQLLRCLDWRFLLPAATDSHFRRLSIPGAPQALVRLAVDLGIADTAQNGLPGKAGADAIAVLDGAGISVSQAAKIMRPGGVLYYEVDRRRAGMRALSPARMARLLRGLHMTPVGFFAVRPHLQAPELFLPLEAPRALSWYVNTLYTAASPPQRLAEMALRAATGLDGRRFAPVAPYYAVTAVAGPAAGRMPATLAQVRDDLDARDVYPLLLADGGNRATVLPFARDGHEPLLVLKVPKLPAFNARTQNEQQALQVLRASLDRRLLETVPRALGTLPLGPVTASVETYCPGQSLMRASSRWGDSLAAKIGALRAASAWLIAFHLRQAGPSRAMASPHWLEDLLATYEAQFGTTSAEETLFRMARHYLRELSLPLPLVQTHRDFNIWNLYQSGQRLHVIDWEGARPGPALCDLLHFVTYWYLAVTARKPLAGHLEGFAHLFFGSGKTDPAGRAVHEALQRYMRALNIDRRLQAPALLYLWVELALRRRAQQTDMGQRDAGPRQGNQFIAYVDLLAQQAPTLFGGGLL